MHVEAAFRRDIQNALRQNQAVGRHDEDVRFEFGNWRDGARILQGRGLQHLDTLVQGELFDRAGREPLAAPGRTIRLRQPAVQRRLQAVRNQIRPSPR